MGHVIINVWQILIDKNSVTACRFCLLNNAGNNCVFKVRPETIVFSRWRPETYILAIAFRIQT